ncbi:hypothetical protein [Asanoa siamensis]|uniref:SnoaL-like domain-containing protein n=1 Tax=Asanoa siamensis TaxID=926357 RepID=A0ABQ4CLC4_9ACTN|nr:hypothetical protein [Asanoa siamensis]GIF72080.1 hypothetical protein Asi02nite_15980 [Asanoa siamensis]
MELMRDPRDALNNVMESFVFTYRFDAQRRRVVFVVDYPFTSPGSIREFAAFVFEEAEFQRLPGDYAAYQSITDFYQGKGPGGMVVQHIEQKTLGPGRDWVELYFGPNFGGIAITYGRLTGYTRGSTATQTGPMDWQYRDSKTNETFQFEYPFPALAGPLE